MKQKVKQNKKVAKKPVAKQEEEVINEAELLQEDQPQQEEAPVVEPMAVEEEGGKCAANKNGNFFVFHFCRRHGIIQSKF